MRHEVKSIFILYTPGHAGNFLLRLFALDETVVPAMPKQMMTDWVVTAVKPDFSLLPLYYFDTVKQDYKNNWLDFHLAWSDIYDKVWYESLTDLVPQYTNIVYQIHPFEFRLHEQVIASLDNKQFFYVDLDLSKYGNWVSESAEKLGFEQRGDELNDGKLLCDTYNMQRIDLNKILDSEDTFIVEYNRVCIAMDITPHPHKAIILRNNWLSKRRPCKIQQ